MPTLDVIIDADTRGLNNGLDDAEKRFGGLGGIAKGAGLAVAGGLAIGGAAAVKFAGDAIGAASDLNETLNKSKVIFGQHADDIEAWGDTAAQNFGLSKAAAIEAAAGFGNMFTQLGQGKGQAAATSQEVVKLAADLGSFNNLGTEEVLDKISGAFRGEYDSLQALIPNINAARVEKEALSATGKTLAEDLTAEEKAMAALAIIQKDGAAAAGDFERTQDSLSNQQKILAARFEDVKAALGDKLLPIATDAIGIVNDLFSGNSELADGLKEHLGPAFKSYGEYVKDVIEIGKDLYHWFIEEIAPALLDFFEPILEAVSDGFDSIREAIKDNEPELRDLLEVFKEVAEFIAQKVLPILGDLIGLGLDLVFAAIGDVIEGIATLVGWFQDAWDAVNDLKNLLGSIDWDSLIPDIDLPNIPGLGRTVAGGGLVPGSKFDQPAAQPQQIIFHLTGALDPVSTARQIKRILSDLDALNGAPDWSLLS